MIDDVLKPKDPEIVEGERICEEMREIAKKLPQPVTTSRERITQFGNSFYLLFLSLKQEKQKSDLDLTYLRRKAEQKYGEKWKKFLEDNADLLTEINKVLEQQEISRELTIRFIVLFKNLKTREQSNKINEEINLEGIEIEIWGKLNPLLKRASEAMAQCGIKPEDFYA